MSEQAVIEASIANRKFTRSMQMLTGIVTGIVADGQLHDLEIHMLNTWLTENPEVTSAWPGSAIGQLLRDVLADGVITPDERTHLLGELQLLAGSDFDETGSASSNVAALPYDIDCLVSLAGQGVCHTGVFVYGTRPACEKLTEKAGGIPLSNPSKKMMYLIVGTHVSPDWINTSYGRKIMAAMDLKKTGHPVVIVSEKRWLEALQH